LEEELTKCQRKQTRPGKGKMRGRRYKRRRGPLIVFKSDDGVSQAFRNIPGVDLCSVDRLNLLQLAPGGNAGRLVVYSESAMKALGSFLKGKKAPKVIMQNDNLMGIINNDAIQSIIREKRSTSSVSRKRNLLSNKKARYETFRGFSFSAVPFFQRKSSEGFIPSFFV
jgi:large subunit ribosomal protein L4e